MIFGKHINRYYLSYSWLLLLGLAALVAVDYMQLEIPELYQMIVNGMNRGYVTLDGVERVFDLDFLLDEICMPMVWIILSMVFGRFAWRVCFFGAAIRVETDLRDRMFDNCRCLSREYYQVNKVGNLMSLFTNDLDTVQECYGWGIMMFCDALLLGALAIAKMWNMDPMLTLLSMIPMVFLMAAATVVGKRLTDKWEYRQECFSRLSDFSQESFSGIAVIKAFVKESRELLAFKKLNVENEEANIDHTRTSVLFRILVMMFVESVICVILGYGGYLVYQGKFNAGQLVEFIGYFTTVVWPIMAVSELIDMTSRGRASLQRISELLDAKADVADRETVRELEKVRGGIEFRDLTFRYPGGEYDVLENISFTIRPGENVGLVGKTGSGKTTLVDLILRTYNVPDGTVFIDGQDINQVSIRSVRAACAYVPQDNFLFSDTIDRNIAFGVPGSERSRIAEAAGLADVDENIRSFQLGYDTVLGERGVTVSGGQKQRISIARALLKDAPILILDDSVSAVDTKTEETILRNLRQTRAGKTTILIAHRSVNDATTDINTYLSENLSGMKITQIFNQEDRKMEDFLLRSRKLQKAKRQRMFVFGIFRPMIYMLFISSNLFLFYIGAKGYIQDTAFMGQVITSEIMVAFYMYISKFFNPIQTLAEQFDMLQKSFASAEKIFTVLDMVPEVVDEEDAIELEEIKGEIEFKDVWFAYKEGEWVLKGVSFHVEPKQTVAFVGSTGSGKTTILSLICRNYDIQKGKILIDGIDIRRIKIASLRKHFGQMLQDVFLFAGDIRSNILLRSEGISDEEVWDACRYVNADSFIRKLEKGLDEPVRERGNNFSAGQRQLLSFARTILHKPGVMILDEATANIDTETELLIQDSLEKMKNIGTMLIVAHRLSTIQRADNIILLSGGEILEQGNHQQLLQQHGRYYQLYTLQYEKQRLQNL